MKEKCHVIQNGLIASVFEIWEYKNQYPVIFSNMCVF